MLTKVLLITILSFSISCFADSTKNKSNSSTDANKLILPVQSDSSTKKQTSQSTQDINSRQESSPKKQSPMIEYCRKHTC
ncbi:hypothetical protein SAMN05428952_106410 [Nitrosomonas sp. Nm132]|jgi:hypothetical protein|nr:hypothetical protein SAMN05428952_106410 [Nitrosomonas sp. Nm132]SDY16275.1 hypothetical protein SAMN05421754_1002155 [Nitrosomonas sp. Nm58]